MEERRQDGGVGRLGNGGGVMRGGPGKETGERKRRRRRRIWFARSWAPGTKRHLDWMTGGEAAREQRGAAVTVTVVVDDDKNEIKVNGGLKIKIENK